MARRLKQNFNEVQAILDAVDHKVDKVEGKDLSTNDYTDEDKAKLSSVEEGAEPNVQGDWDQADTTSDDYIKNKPDLSVKADLPLEDVDIPGLTVRNGYITASGVWNSGDVYCHTLLPVSAGKAVRVTAAESNLFRYAWLTSGRAPRGGIAADLVPGTERTDVAAGSSVSLVVPDGAKYLYVYLGTPAAKANTPESMAVSDTIASLRKDTDTNAGDIAVLGEEARHSGVYGHFDGAGSVTVYGGNIFVVAGMSYRLIMLHPDITVTNPTGNVWRLVVSARDDSGAVVSNLVQVSDVSRLSDHYDLTIPSGATRLYIYGRCSEGQTCDYVLERLDTVTYNDGDILTLNPDSEFLTKWQSAMKPYYTSQSTNKPNCVRFLHLSDVHGNWANVRRFLKFYNHWVDNGYDITAINTGDTATDYLTDGVTGYTGIAGADKILGVIGNHDTRGAQGWQQYKGLEVYNALFAPLISGWGVVQPEGAAENGYCYYHKDYASNKLRLVVVDIMGYDDTEDAWLASVLASAKTAGYHVLIATHFAGGRSSAEASQPPYKKIDCQWSTMAGLASDSTQLNGYNSESYKMADTVHAFMEDGGIFCGYMCGHSHLEFVARLDKYPDQMIYTIGSSKSGKVHDYTHTTGTRMQDEFEIVAVDTDSKFVKLYKVGANYDRRGRHKDSICVSYDTHEVVGFPVTTEALAKEMDGKQDTLVSGRNIKTINGESVLGGGNIQIEGGQSVQSDWDEDDPTDPAYIKNKPTIPTNVVKYTEQELTDAQKAQARTNIAAASESELSQLRSEISDVAYNKDNVQSVAGKWKNNNGVVNTGTSGTLFRFNPIPIIPGKQFTYTTLRAGTAGPSLIIADSYDNVLVESNESNGTMLAPEHAAKLYFNSTKAGFSCTIRGILNSFPMLEETVSKLSGIDSLMAKGAGSESPIYLEEFEQGNISGDNGQPLSSTKCIRTTDYIHVIQGSTLTYSLNTGFLLGLAFYEYDGTFIIKREWFSGSGSDVVPTNSYFLKVIIKHPSGDITPDDLSDAGLVLRTDHVAENVPCAPLENVKRLESLIGEFGVYPSNAQKPADGSSDSDFDAENITPQELYDAFDGLAGKICPPNSAIYPKYITEYYKEGDDATETYKIKAYVLTKRDRFAWLHADKLYAWKNGNTVVYIDSCSPRIGDTIYSDDQRTDSGMTVASYDSSTQSFTSSSSSVFTRSNTDNVAADILFSKELKSSGNLALFNRSDASAGTATLTDQTHLTVSGKSYVRCDSFDYHTATKGTIVLWANEHGAQSDPYEGSITMYNLARDLTLGGFRNNEFLLFLKDYIKVVIIPCANPYSMYMYATTKREGRFNANGVNLNRNYDTPGWALYSGEPKGNYAGDQNETQFIMNTCLSVEAALGIDVHCLSYTTDANQGKCHHSGRIPSSTVNSKVRIVMQNYGLEYSNYGDADPETGGAGKDWLLFNGIVGGLIEMNAGPYASAFDGGQHSAFFLEADYALLLNAIKMWWYGVDPEQFIY